MTGGPMLDHQGRLIGIHVESTGPKLIKELEISANQVVKTSLTIGVSTNKFLNLVSDVAPDLKFQSVSSISTTEPKTAGDYFLLGRKKNENIDYLGTLVALNKAIALNPDVAMFYVDRGLAHKSLGNYAQAILDYKKAISMNAEHAIVYGNRGSVFTLQIKYLQALKDYKKALELDPNDARLHVTHFITERQSYDVYVSLTS